MANDLKGENAIKALGKTWTLSLPFRVAKALKKDHGLDLMSGGVDMADLDTFEVLFAAMIRVHHPEIAESEIEDIITALGVKPAVEALLPCLAAFTGVPLADLQKAGAAPQ